MNKEPYINIDCNQPTFIDVDDTLLSWEYEANPSEDRIKIECDGYIQYLRPMKKNIEQLKAHAARGHTVFVWSAGGSRWADAVVKSLGLQEFVRASFEKPMFILDDLHPSEFMPKNRWYKDE